MIEVSLAVENVLNVLKFESQLANVSFDLRRSFLESSVKKNVALRARDQKDGDIAGAE